MNYPERATVVTVLVDCMHKSGSWAGGTHVQKSVYILQTLMDVPLKYDFTLYKFGPYSFDLKEELTQMRIDGFLDLKTNPAPFGPSFVPSDLGEGLRKSAFVKKYDEPIKFVSQKVSNRGVSALERISTALFVTQEKPEASLEERALRINELKPHISIVLATNALKEVEGLQEAAQV